ncbi:hypothetical protein ACIHFB_24920 [Streptomyces sp. NPDC051963]|uniref:hypothetical protein n=1 Tax=Streptomyces sp. NPDC051963 TaxID=3365678 RepID=UPI0037CFC80B
MGTSSRRAQCTPNPDCVSAGTSAHGLADPAPELDSIRCQVDQALERASRHHGRQRLFPLVNVSAPHVPHGRYVCASQDRAASQAAALSYADGRLGRLLDGLAEPGHWLVIMCTDHGDAYRDDSHHGRGIAHPAVFNVPFASWVHARLAVLYPIVWSAGFEQGPDSSKLSCAEAWKKSASW